MPEPIGKLTVTYVAGDRVLVDEHEGTAVSWERHDGGEVTVWPEGEPDGERPHRPVVTYTAIIKAEWQVFDGLAGD